MGEIVGAVIVATGTVFLLTGELVSSEVAQEIATDIDYGEYLKTVKNESSQHNYSTDITIFKNLLETRLMSS